MNEILKQISNIGIRRKKMEQKSSERTKSKTKKVRFNLYVPGTKKLFLAGDSNGCVLVVPEVFGTHKNNILCQERILEYQL